MHPIHIILPILLVLIVGGLLAGCSIRDRLKADAELLSTAVELVKELRDDATDPAIVSLVLAVKSRDTFRLIRAAPAAIAVLDRASQDPVLRTRLTAFKTAWHRRRDMGLFGGKAKAKATGG